MTMTMTMAGATGPGTGAGGDDGAFRLWPRMLVGFVLAVALIGGVGGWAVTAQLSGAVIASGQIVVEAKVQTIQHRDGGIVSAIAVKEGDEVAKGQLLIRLDDAQTRSELAIVRAQLMELEVKRARLLAERDGRAALALPSGWAEAHPEAGELITGEARLLAGMAQNRDSQRRQLELGVAQIGDEVKGLQGQRAAKAEEIALVATEFERTRKLFDSGLIEVTRLNGVAREKARLDGELSEIDSAIARAGTRASEVRLQILSIDETARTEAQRELGLVETRLSELTERAVAVEDRLGRTDVLAPIAGVVNELNVNTLGGVVTPAQALLTLVPLESELRVEVRLAPVSIEQVHVDQEARLRFPAFNQRVTPELHGRVVHVAPATTRDPATGEPYYQGFIEIGTDELALLGEAKLMPGMPVEVLVSTGERSAGSYLMKPLMDRFSQAFRER